MRQFVVIKNIYVMLLQFIKSEDMILKLRNIFPQMINFILVIIHFDMLNRETKNMNYDRVLENIVAIELLRRGYEVYVGVLYRTKIDFVEIKRNEKIYIQISENISDNMTFKIDVAPLLRINDAFSTMVIVRTRHEGY